MFDKIPSLNFWLSINSPDLSLVEAGVFALTCVALLIVGVVLIFIAKKTRKVDHYLATGQSRLASWFILLALVSLLWDFFAYERIRLFGAPFWLVIVLIGAIVWLVFIVIYIIKTVPALHTKQSEKILKEKYLPKKKK